MNKLILLLGLLIIGIIVGLYLYISQTPTPQTPTPQTPQNPTPQNPTNIIPKMPSFISKDATCFPNITTESALNEIITADLYDFDETKQLRGKDIKTLREPFALPIGTKYDKSELVNDTVYTIGTLIPSKQITTISPAQQGGPTCLQFPTVIFLPSSNAKNQIRYIRLIQPLAQCLNIAEIRVFNLNGQNIAIGKPVTITRQYGDFVGSNIVDGNSNTFGHSQCDSGNYIDIDLGSDIIISRIEIVNRQDCCQDRIVGSYLRLFNSFQYPSSQYIERQITTKSNIYVFDLNENGFI